MGGATQRLHHLVEDQPRAQAEGAVPQQPGRRLEVGCNGLDRPVVRSRGDRSPEEPAEAKVEGDRQEAPLFGKLGGD